MTENENQANEIGQKSRPETAVYICYNAYCYQCDAYI
jgi:hypothetical protein